MDEQTLKERFIRDVGCPSRHYRLNEVWTTLWTSYHEPHRAYHNMQHIVECLDLLDEKFNDAGCSLVRIALWFHDIVYRDGAPGTISDEELSAAWTKEALRTLIASHPNRGYNISELIRFTEYKRAPLGVHEQILHDIDFAILGAVKERFHEYCQGIVQEYSWVVSGAFFEMKRREFLTQLLEREHIYYTATMRTSHEQQARQNITGLLGAL